MPTRAALQRRRDRAWAPAVGDRCEGRYRAGPDGLALRKAWYPGAIVGEGAAGLFHVSYDDGDQEDAVAREFVRPPLPAVAAPAASRGSQRSAGDPHREVDCRHSVGFCDVRWPTGQLGPSASGFSYQ